MDRTVAVTSGQQARPCRGGSAHRGGMDLERRSRTLAGQPAHFIRPDLTDYGKGQR
jgi:hypothetical protein